MVLVGTVADLTDLRSDGVMTRMSNEYTIGVIDEESVLAECGPMRLVIRAWKKNQPQIKLARRAAEESISYLERIARCRPLLSRPIPQIEDLPEDELALKVTKEIVIKYIEIGRLSLNAFYDAFRQIHDTVRGSIKGSPRSGKAKE